MNKLFVSQLLFFVICLGQSFPVRADLFEDLFRGNTRRDRRDYGLEERSDYRKSRHLTKVQIREQEEEILRRLKAEDDRKNKVKSRRKSNSVRVSR